MASIREMLVADYAEVRELWGRLEGMRLEAADSEAGVTRYLTQNPGLSFVATEGDRIIGSVLCGQDGRRGYLQHLSVTPEYRNRGVGSALLAAAAEAFARHELHEIRIFVLRDNSEGLEFWRKRGWDHRYDIDVFTHKLRP
ncbi:MAG: GNAT family N-acetyltransferase [Planctomycetota bacterium]